MSLTQLVSNAKESVRLQNLRAESESESVRLLKQLTVQFSIPVRHHLAVRLPDVKSVAQKRYVQPAEQAKYRPEWGNLTKSRGCFLESDSHLDWQHKASFKGGLNAQKILDNDGHAFLVAKNFKYHSFTNNNDNARVGIFVTFDIRDENSGSLVSGALDGLEKLHAEIAAGLFGQVYDVGRLCTAYDSGKREFTLLKLAIESNSHPRRRFGWRCRIKGDQLRVK